MKKEKRFEELWKKHIEDYGKSFGSIYNGFNRRRNIARQFYTQGVLDTYIELNKK